MLDDETLDRIDEIIPPGNCIGQLQMACNLPPSQRRPSGDAPSTNDPLRDSDRVSNILQMFRIVSFSIDHLAQEGSPVSVSFQLGPQLGPPLAVAHEEVDVARPVPFPRVIVDEALERDLVGQLPTGL